MIAKTHAIPLRWWPVTNTSRIVAWLTRDFGRISTLIKGSQRPKSTFLGQFDLFYRCELLFYTREKDELHIARECTPLDTRNRLRHDWRATLASSYAGSLCMNVAPIRGNCADIYALLETFIRHLDRRGFAPGAVPWFELALLERLGLAPRLDHCASCGRPLLDANSPTRFSPQSGGAVDQPCAEKEGAQGFQISPIVLRQLHAWQHAPTLHHVKSASLTAGQHREMHVFMREFLAYHTEFPPHRRDRLNALFNPVDARE